MGEGATERTDAELVRLTRSGDREAYGRLVARYQGHVYGLAYSLCGRWADAQDIAQEAFIRAYANLDQLRGPERFAAWLRRVTFGVAMNWMRAYRPGLFEQLDGRVELDALEIPDFRPGPQEVVEKRELAEAVLTAVESLPAKYRVPLTMFHLNGLSYQKVADFLDIPLGSVKALIHRARRKLRSLLPAHVAEEVTPMVQEVFDEHKLPPEFRREVLDEITSKWWDSMDAAQSANAAAREAEAEALEAVRKTIGGVPKWARQTAESMPRYGFEICSHRWLDGLDHVMQMIGSEEFHPSAAGCCGDVPGRVVAGAEARAAAVQQWVDGAGTDGDDLGRQVAGWLGDLTPAKKEAAECFTQVVRAVLLRPEEEAEPICRRWRSRAESNPMLQRLFYGDGLDEGLRNACGFQTIRRLEILIRVTGGDDSQLQETRWFCNTQLRFVLRDDPARLYITLGYLWGLHAYLAGRDEEWLRSEKPQCAGAAIYALRRVSQAGPPTPLRRWLAASLLSATKFWYQRALNFVGPEHAPAYARDVPEVVGAGGG